MVSVKDAAGLVVLKGDTYRDGKVHVVSERCNTCIFSPGKRFVEGKRVAELVSETKDEPGSTVTCHKTIYNDLDNAICRGWYDHFAKQDPILRLAKAMEIIEEQELEE